MSEVGEEEAEGRGREGEREKQGRVEVTKKERSWSCLYPLAHPFSPSLPSPPSPPSFLSLSSNGCGLAQGTGGRRQEASALWAEREATQIVAAV